MLIGPIAAVLNRDQIYVPICVILGVIAGAVKLMSYIIVTMKKLQNF